MKKKRYEVWFGKCWQHPGWTDNGSFFPNHILVAGYGTESTSIKQAIKNARSRFDNDFPGLYGWHKDNPENWYQVTVSRVFEHDCENIEDEWKEGKDNWKEVYSDKRIEFD